MKKKDAPLDFQMQMMIPLLISLISYLWMQMIIPLLISLISYNSKSMLRFFLFFLCYVAAGILQLHSILNACLFQGLLLANKGI